MFINGRAHILDRPGYELGEFCGFLLFRCDWIDVMQLGSAEARRLPGHFAIRAEPRCVCA